MVIETGFVRNSSTNGYVKLEEYILNWNTIPPSIMLLPYKMPSVRMEGLERGENRQRTVVEDELFDAEEEALAPPMD